MTELRLLTYNIRSLLDDASAVTRVIRGLSPDVVCLQEVPRFFRWRRKRNRLARACGLAVASSRRRAGLAVFVAPCARVVHREYHLLRRVPLLHRRGLAIAVLEFGTGQDAARLIVACTHLDLRSEARQEHVREIFVLLDGVRARFAAPVVLAGDINEQPGGSSWNLLTGRLRDAHAVAPDGEPFTFTSRAPAKRIDGVFTDPDVQVLSCGVPADPAITANYAAATDHRPVKADLLISGASASGP